MSKFGCGGLSAVEAWFDGGLEGGEKRRAGMSLRTVL